MILPFLYRYFIAAVFFTAASYLHAAGIQEVSATSSLWKVVASLVFIIAFIPACVWLMKRFQLAQMKLGQADIKVVSVQSLGAKEKLMLVEVEGERMLIGVTANTITHLKTISPKPKSFASVMDEVDEDGLNGSHGSGDVK
ncbi:flagellar biosynthesis protein FliO [Marinomonas ushuaiensis DSM 15871]|uniref:Flagellar protein n=1 Tax=Marinomonas ushuaiensis DSM 15871 TaxID=1122207 RepID=X7E4E5_9GAMM|nr:flagellar biosynthetic protein FliO [Marinomonas ushuaiensis]ETX10894.1 flagellar biosynthesis protein FliO [Marinomonas ushuaiensis DSM 15871]